MIEQQPIDYFKIFAELMNRRAILTRQRDEAEVEIAKIKPLILSVFPLLTDEQRKVNQQAVDDIEADSSGLQDAIKLVFSAHSDEWLTVSKVRDYLDEMGFDLRRYKANPLASIGTTLKRMAGEFIESMSTDNGTLYRRIQNSWAKIVMDAASTVPLSALAGNDTSHPMGKLKPRGAFGRDRGEDRRK